MRPLMTIEQVAEVLNVTPARIYSWRHVGKGPEAVQLEGRLLRWKPETVEEWLEEQSERQR